MSFSEDTEQAETPVATCVTSDAQGFSCAAPDAQGPAKACAEDDAEPADADAEAEPADAENVPRGIKWTYREVLRGKADVILVADAAFFLLLSVVAYFASEELGVQSPSLIARIVRSAIQLKADEFASNLATALIVFAPFMLIIWPVVALFVMLGLRIRDRKVPLTEQNLLIHKASSARAWTWPWSIMVGVFDFTALFYVLVLICSPLGENLDGDVVAVCSLLGTLLCLVFAERRVVRVSHAMSAKLPGNRLSLLATLDGTFDSLMDEEYRNDIARVKAATIIDQGVVRSPHHAIMLVKGIALRTKVKLFSAFLNSMLHGMIATFTFGIAATVVNGVGAVDGVFASGRDGEYVANLRNPSPTRPYFAVEIVAATITAAAATIEFITAIEALGL